MTTMSAGAQSWVRGDADGDGYVTSLDATYIQRVIADMYPDPDRSISKRGSVINDTMTLMDATEIQLYLAGCGNRYHIGEQNGDIPFFDEDNQLPILTKE